MRGVVAIDYAGRTTLFNVQTPASNHKFCHRGAWSELPFDWSRSQDSPSMRRESIMGKASLVQLVISSVGASLAVIAGAGLAHADPPSPGDSCSQFGASTQDINGQTMWCQHTSTGGHSLVWQYGDPSNEHG
jgi:hypothetical protein